MAEEEAEIAVTVFSAGLLHTCLEYKVGEVEILDKCDVAGGPYGRVVVALFIQGEDGIVLVIDDFPGIVVGGGPAGAAFGEIFFENERQAIHCRGRFGKGIGTANNQHEQEYKK